MQSGPSDPSDKKIVNLFYICFWKAWLKLVQMEREEAEKERKKEEEERRKRKEEAKRRSRILEAAFDGDNDEILAVLEEVIILVNNSY